MSAMAIIEEVNPEHAHIQLAPVAPGAMQLLLDLEASGALTPRAMNLPTDIDYDRYESLGAFLGEFKSRVNFYLGDWLIHGESTFGERFAQASEATGLAEQTLLRIMAVCRNVPAARRRDALSFSVHAAVQSLDVRAQNRWLKKAEGAGWGYAELRKAMQAARHDERPQMFDDEAEGEPIMDRVLEVARLLVANAEIAGENVIVRREDYVQLRAALGLEE